MIVLKIVLILVVLDVVFDIVSYVARAAYRLDDEHDETHFVACADGWRIALHRVKPSRPDPDKLPVILCHGLGANRFNLNFPGRHSLARYLADRGYDAYVLELRGAGLSTRKRFFDPVRWDFGFLDFVEFDLPAAIDHVLKVTGKPRVHWVGHSMGGMVAYAFAQRPAAEKLASLCAVGSPGHFRNLSQMRGAARLKCLLAPFPVVRVDWIFGAFIPLVGHWNPKFITDNYNPENMAVRTAREAGANLVSPVSRKLLLDFAHYVETGRFEGADGTDFAAGLDRVARPVFLISGSVDKLAPRDCVEFVHARVVSADKKYRCFGKEFGDLSDYGHGDLLLGETAPDEVFPAIAEWLEAHDA